MFDILIGPKMQILYPLTLILIATVYMHYRTLEYVNPVPFLRTNRKI
jgi:hypothetical protein